MDFAGRFVFPYDAKDIKAHKWFKGVPWERLHELDPPFVPMIRSPDDTQYFNDDEPITDFSESDDEDEDNQFLMPEDSTPRVNLDAAAGRDGPIGIAVATSTASTINHTQLPSPPASNPGTRIRDDTSASVMTQITVAAPLITTTTTSVTTYKKRAECEARLAQALSRFDRGIQHAMRSWLAIPYDTLRLRNFQLQVDVEPGLRASERDALKMLVRIHGRKERKRPRDRLLRDPDMRKAVLEERKKTAFMGYDWARIEPMSLMPIQMTGPANGVHAELGAIPILTASVTTEYGLSAGGSDWPCYGAPPGHEHLAAMRALHYGRLSLH